MKKEISKEYLDNMNNDGQLFPSTMKLINSKKENKQINLKLSRAGFCYKCLNNGIKKLREDKDLMFCNNHNEEIRSSHVKRLSEN